MDEEPFDALSGPPPEATSPMSMPRPKPSAPPSAAFAHSTSPVPTGTLPQTASEQKVDPSPPVESFGLPPRWSQYEKDIDTYRPSDQTRPRADVNDAERSGTQDAGSVTAITPAKQPKSSYTNYELFNTPSPGKHAPPTVTPTLGSGYSFKRSESYDTAELIKKYAMYRPPPPAVPPAVRSPNIRGASPVQSPRDQNIRKQAIKVLDLVDDHLKTPLDVRRTASGGFRAAPPIASNDTPYVVRRTPSGSIVNDPKDPVTSSEPYYVRRTASGTITSGSGRKVPAALAGLNMTQEEQRQHREQMRIVGANRSHQGRFARPGRYSFTDANFHDDDAVLSDEEDDILSGQAILDDLVDEMLDFDGQRGSDPLVDVVHMENRSASSRSAVATKENEGKSWSSRYLSDWNTQGVFNQFDRDSDRQRQTARNMFASSAHSVRAAVEANKGRVFGAGFSFRQNHVFGQKDGAEKSEVNHWSNIRENTDPVPTTTRKTWQEAMLSKRKRRRIMIVLGLFLSCLIIVITVVSTRRRQRDRLAVSQANSEGIGLTVSFYATSDVPYNSQEEGKLQKDLANLPVDADFVAHLGNIQDASVSMCPKTRYSDVASVLRKSPVPLFVVPGEEDWVSCPSPRLAFSNWLDAFNSFEDYFNHGFRIFRPRDRPEVFAMLHNGVLFVGLHLVGGTVQNEEGKSQRELDMLTFYFGMLNLHKDKFRAVVLLGNAHPGPSTTDFFDGVITSLKPVGKPLAYVFANSGYGGVRKFTPFEEHPEIVGIEIQDGGQNLPLRITVGFGDDIFTIGN